ncbi:hypothetical protein [Lysobacter gummosus]
MASLLFLSRPGQGGSPWRSRMREPVARVSAHPLPLCGRGPMRHLNSAAQ